MLAKFSVIGYLGKITVPEKLKDRDCLFLSVVTSNIYNGTYYTQWLNNVALWGPRAKFVQKKAKPGQLWFFEGDFKVVRGGRAMFNVETFRMLRENNDEQVEKLQKRELEKFQEEIHAYDEFEDDLYDELEYEKIKKETGNKKSIKEM